MALNLLTGRTGSAKSYKAVEEILKCFSSGRKVFTNIKLNIEDENYHYIDELAVREFLMFIETTFKEVSNLEEKKAFIRTTKYFEADFFIDEAHLVGFRDKKESILNWLTLQRHFFQNITIITQVATNLNRDYLQMFHGHIEMLHGKKRLSKEHLGFKEFDSYKGERIQTKHFKPNQEIFDIYESGAKEVGQSQDVKKIIQVVAGLIVALLIIGFSISGLFDSAEKNMSDITNPKLVQVDNVISKDANITYPTVICSTNETCLYDGVRYTYNKFVNKVLLRFDNPEKHLLMSSKRYAMYKFTLK